MEYLETQYSQPVKHTDKKGKSISTHFIDQLMDHPWAMRLYFANQPSISEENPLLYSAVRFCLPYKGTAWSPFTASPELIVVGDGMNVEVFGSKIYLPEDKEYQRGKLSLFESSMFESGNYAGDYRGTNFLLATLPPKAAETYTTGIQPFLSQGGYPPYGAREYYIRTGPVQNLIVIAEIGKEYLSERLRIVYEDTSSQRKQFPIVTLSRKAESGDWIADTLNVPLKKVKSS